MPIPDALWSQLLANTQASGQSFNPWGLGGQAAPASGMSIDEAIQEARLRLSGQWPPPAASPQATPPGEDLGMFGEGVGGPGPGPSSATLGVGQSYGYNPSLASLALSFLGTANPTLGPVPAGALQGARALNSLGPVQSFLSEAAPFGVITEQGPTPAVISQTARDTPGFANTALSTLGFGGVPTGVSFMDEFGFPGNTVALGTDRTSETGITPGYGGGLSGGLGTSAVGAPGSESSGAAPGGDTSGPGGGPGGTGASEGGQGTESGHRGGYVKGTRGREKKMKVLPGEFIMNPKATDEYGPLLEELNRSKPNTDLDGLMAKARAFWTV